MGVFWWRFHSGSVFPPAAWVTQARWCASQTVKEELGVGGWDDSCGEKILEEEKKKSLEAYWHTNTDNTMQQRRISWWFLIGEDVYVRITDAHIQPHSTLFGMDAFDLQGQKTLNYAMHKFSDKVMDF